MSPELQHTQKKKKPGYSLAVAFDFALSAANDDFNKNLERSTSYAFISPNTLCLALLLSILLLVSLLLSILLLVSLLLSILLLVSWLRSILLLVSWSTMSWELLRSNLAAPKQS